MVVNIICCYCGVLIGQIEGYPDDLKPLITYYEVSPNSTDATPKPVNLRMCEECRRRLA